jgi:hypothetical protein
VGGRRVNRECEEGQIWWIYFVFMHENRTMKLVEIALKCERGMTENDGGESN